MPGVVVGRWLTFLERNFARLDAVRVLQMVPDKATPLKAVSGYLCKVVCLARQAAGTAISWRANGRHGHGGCVGGWRCRCCATARRSGGTRRWCTSCCGSRRCDTAKKSASSMTTTPYSSPAHSWLIAPFHTVWLAPLVVPCQLKIQQELIQEQSRRVVVTESTVCGVPTCKRLIGNTAILCYPNGTVVHFACGRCVAGPC